jgi:hypothetical protein
MAACSRSGRTDDRTPRTTVIAACPLCEAMCGLEIEVTRDGPEPRIATIRGNKQDVFSKGSSARRARASPGCTRIRIA